MVLHDVTFNVTATIKKFYKVPSVEVLSQDPHQQNDFLLTHNYKYGVEIWAMCAKLDLEVSCKRPKKIEVHLIFINFGVKKFTLKNTQKKENFNVWML
jgi:hypothetical protein